MEKAASSGNLISDDLKRKKNAHLIENDDLSQLTWDSFGLLENDSEILLKIT